MSYNMRGWVLIQFMAEATFTLDSVKNGLSSGVASYSDVSPLEVNLRAKKGGREKTGKNLLPMVSCASTILTLSSSLPLSAT